MFNFITYSKYCKFHPNFLGHSKRCHKINIKSINLPAKGKLRKAVEVYLSKKNLEFFNKFSEKNWLAYYNTYCTSINL